MPEMDRFNKATVVILSYLYDSFPLRVPVKISYLLENPHRLDYDSDLRIYADTLHFLAKEGLISYEHVSAGGISVSDQTFLQTTLTAKGLAMLNFVPDSLQESSTFGKRLKIAALEGSNKELSSLVSQIIEFACAGSI